MSIKHYLFALFGGLILLLGLSQLLIGEALKQQLEQDLREDSVALSRKLVDIVVDELGERSMQFEGPLQISTTELTILSGEGHVQLEQPPQDELLQARLELDNAQSEFFEARKKAIESAMDDLEVMMESQNYAESPEHEALIRESLTRELEKLSRMQEALTRKALQESLDGIHFNSTGEGNNGNLVIVRKLQDGSTAQQDLQFNQSNVSEALSRFREWMAALILVSSMLALVFVYWLSRRVSGPLSDLAQGHRKLGEGELGYRVSPRGVDEVKKMLEGFNAMSEKLAALSAREQQVASQQHLAELGEITRGIAHSLRNPLHTLGLLAESQSSSDDSDERARQLGLIQQKIAMMDKHIQSLLTLSSTAVDRSQPVPVNAVVQDILLELSVSGVKPELKLSGFDIEHRLAGMESEVRSILHAVIINAVEAQSHNSTPWLGIEIKKQDSELVISVSDRGSGIDEGLMTRLGQPHVTTKAEGTGMGLYIASRLLASHYGGRLSFERLAEGGSKVGIYFNSEENQ